MASSNPTYTVADVITDIEARLGTPNLSSDTYIPWVSYAYQKLYNKLISVGQRSKEYLFGDRGDITLTAGTLEYTITDSLSRFGGILKVEVRYGATGDDWVPASPLISISHWKSLDDVSTTYRGKDNPLYYLRRNIIGIIPTPPSGESAQTPTARVWFVRRPNQLTLSGDEIDIPYRYIYPILNYVQGKAVQRLHEDYQESALLEDRFNQELEEVANMVASEFEEGVDGVEVSTSSAIFSSPFDW